MKIGIFINYEPFVSLNSEGLGRYLGTLIRGFVENGDNVTIACPKWSETTLKNLFKDFSIDSTKIELLTPRKIPASIIIYNFLCRRTNLRKNRFDFKSTIEDVLLFFSHRDSIIGFIFYSIVFGLVGVIAVIFLGVFSLLKKILGRIPKATHVKTFVAKKLGIFDELDRFRRKYYEEVMSHNADEIIKMINNSSKKDVWYVPALFWPQVNDIKNQKVIINVPDLITEDFATSFSDLSSAYQTNNCRKTIQGGTNFITYCDYIGKTLIDRNYGGYGKKWVSIKHSNHNLMEYIAIPNDVAVQMNVKKNLTKEFAKNQIMQIYNESIFGDMSQLVNGHYIFYASQFRPHKNILNLIKAYEYLIRFRFRHERLVLTGSLANSPDVRNYIEDHDLSNEIVFCRGVSAQKLAALYCCADLVVNPTLYEGGFPFTFGEGMSVGTPSIMSDIPQVREVLEPAGLEEIMFDPKDYKAMADKMEWALDNLDYVRKIEEPLYNEMAKRTDEVVAEEYIKTFNKMIME